MLVLVFYTTFYLFCSPNFHIEQKRSPKVNFVENKSLHKLLTFQEVLNEVFRRKPMQENSQKCLISRFQRKTKEQKIIFAHRSRIFNTFFI